MTDKHLAAICIGAAALVYSLGHNGGLFVVFAAVIWLFSDVTE